MTRILTTMSATARQLPTLLLAAGVAFAFAGCSRDNGTADRDIPATDSPVLAIVAGSPITANDLLAEVAHRKQRNQTIPAKEELLEAMINRAALIHRAKASGLDKDPAMRRRLDGLLVSEIRQRELQSQLDTVEVSEEELRAAYAERAQSFTTPAKSRLAILHLVGGKAASDGKRSELRARMTEARDRSLADPAPGGLGPAARGFGTLAVEFSDDQVSRYRGGDAGWFTPGQAGTRWPAEVLKAGLLLAQGEVSEVIESKGDFFLVRKTGELAEATTSFENAIPAIRQQLVVAKRETIERAFHDENGRLAKVKTMPEALASIKFPASPSATEPKPPEMSGASQ
jgi:peptidyl-prolyl cis-trans isomerase C